MENVDIIAACSDLGIHIDGAALGPYKLIESIDNHNIIKIDKLDNIRKDLSKDNKRKNLEGVNLFNVKLYNKSLQSLNNNKFPLTIAGDHSIAIGSSLASIKKYNNLGIIWFDAHGDFNTFDTTISGNIHGIPLAAITNYEKKYLTDFHNGNYYNPKNTVIIGARDLDKLEKENIQDAGITVFTTEDIKNKGFEHIYEEAFKIASLGTNGIHISYDLDVIDPKFAPGVSIPVENGINETEAFKFIDYIIKYKNLVKSMDLVEFNPLKDVDDKTLNLAKGLLYKVLDIKNP